MEVSEMFLGSCAAEKKGPDLTEKGGGEVERWKSWGREGRGG